MVGAKVYNDVSHMLSDVFTSYEMLPIPRCKEDNFEGPVSQLRAAMANVPYIVIATNSSGWSISNSDFRHRLPSYH